MSLPAFSLVYFLYGLAFFSMGLAITLEVGHGSDLRLRHALRPLAAFGVIHGAHEWLEMFMGARLLPALEAGFLAWESLRLGLLAFSFLSLSAFGSSLLATDERRRRLSLLAPLLQATLWGFGLLLARNHYSQGTELWGVADVWTRYVLGVPSALLACAGLVTQQRAFRQAGMARFGQDSLWAAVAFAWYGLVGQVFTRMSALPPSTVINDRLFSQIFGVPVQLVRGGAALVAAVFVMRFLRSFEVEKERHIAELQTARLQEAQRREALRGELLNRVVGAQEAERQRIARELHDETGQALTALGLGLRGVGGMVTINPPKAAENLRNLEDMVRRSLDDLQHLISGLRPSHLDDLGLPAALRWYASNLKEGICLQVKVDVRGKPKPIPPDVQTAMFRIAQEALTNTIKHAGATHARILLQFGDEAVILEVEDDGCGFDMSVLKRVDRPPWGLLGMEERASLLGGELRLDSQPGRGTRVEARIPYQVRSVGEHEDPLASGG